MVRTYKRKNSKAYTNENIKEALQAIDDGLSVNLAAKQYDIPRSTLRDKRINRRQSNSRAGHKTIFSAEQESRLISRISYMADRGFPLTSKRLCNVAFSYAKFLGRRKKLQCTIPKNWEKFSATSKDWLLGFKKRNPQVALRVPEGLSKARAEAFNKDRVDMFFNDVEKLFASIDLKDYPSLVTNCDETGLSSVPNSSNKVFAVKGTKQVQQLTLGERGTLTTILIAVNATGSIMPPFIIFKGTRLPDVSQFPTDTFLTCSKSGYIDQHIFLDFLKHYNRHRVSIENKKAVLYFDGHRSHVTIEAIEYSIENNIELVCLPPHSSHRLQPLDTHFNKVLKQKWSEALSNYLLNSDDLILPRDKFHRIFNPVWESMAEKRGLIVDAFAHCGLYPVKNTVKPNEFNKSGSFESTSLTPSQTGELETLLRNVIPSPKKCPNMSHKKKHVAHLTSISTSIESSSAIKQMKEVTFADFISQKNVSQNNSAVISEETMTATTISSQKCAVCDAVWEKATEDWLQCIVCSLWACEACFGTDKCANCCL